MHGDVPPFLHIPRHNAQSTWTSIPKYTLTECYARF